MAGDRQLPKSSMDGWPSSRGHDVHSRLMGVAGDRHILSRWHRSETKNQRSEAEKREFPTLNDGEK